MFGFFDRSYYIKPEPTWTITKITYKTRRRVFYHASRPGKRWK